MSRINTNIPSLVATRVLNTQNKSLQTSLERLSTGLRINTGKDDPAGLIASENLRSERTAIQAALTNISRARNVVAVAEGGLDEVNKLLTELEDLLDRSANEAGITDDERDANQLQIDAILDSINRVANTTEFQGRKLLSGELDYTTSAVDTTAFKNVDIKSARISNNSYRDVVVDVAVSAQLATLTYAASASPAGTVTLEIKGNLGTEVLSFASGTSISEIAQAINQSKDLTGVSATTFSATGLRFESTSYGSAQFVSVRALEGTFTVTGGDSGLTKDFGRDPVVRVNGILADAEGLHIRSQTSTLSIELDLAASFGGAIGSSTFSVTGGGGDFMISPTVSLNGLASLGIRGVTTTNLGNPLDGSLSSIGSGQSNSLTSGNFAVAQRILRASQEQVAELRGRLGAFIKNTLETASNALNIAYENTTAAESSIRDADFATETSNLTRSQILVQSATTVLRLANSQPQNVLALLG